MEFTIYDDGDVASFLEGLEERPQRRVKNNLANVEYKYFLWGNLSRGTVIALIRLLTVHYSVISIPDNAHALSSCCAAGYPARWRGGSREARRAHGALRLKCVPHSVKMTKLLSLIPSVKFPPTLTCNCINMENNYHYTCECSCRLSMIFVSGSMFAFIFLSLKTNFFWTCLVS